MAEDNGRDPTDEVDEETLLDAMEILHRIVKDVRLAPETVELQSGIVLKVKHVSEAMLRAVVTSVPKPEVPIVAMGDSKIMEPWPEDPDYLAALTTAMAERNKRLAHACRVIGTECESVPDGYSRPEDDGWIDALRAVGVEPAATELATPMDRYATWLDMHAMSEFLDVNKITQTVIMRSAILEVEVMDAIRFFRSDGPGQTAGDGGPSADDVDSDGSGVRTPDGGAGDGARGKGHGRGRGDTMDDVAKPRKKGKDRRRGTSPRKADGGAAPQRSDSEGAEGTGGPRQS